MSKILVVIVLLMSARTVHADAGDRWDGVMILEQTGGAVLGGGVGGGILMAVGAGIASKTSSRGDWGAGLAGAVIGGSVGAVTGVTIGVKLAGDARGGNGSWGATIAGAVGGGVLVLVTAPQYVDKVPTYVSVGLFAASLVGPPILAYHLSTDENAADHASRVVVPLLLTTF